jgi:rhamnogalacturonyl hydrolase YesR
MNQLIGSGSNPFSRSLLTAIGLIGLALASAQAVTPAPDGGYANQNTAEGTSALFSLTTGVGNTALGFQALYFDNIQSYNTAVGVRALRSNGTDGNTAIGWQALYKNSKERSSGR